MLSSVSNHHHNKCDVGGKECSSKSSLKAHLLMIHTDKKPFKCNSCGRTCASRSELKTHERIHTGEKPFKCQFCPKAFASSWNKTRHERVVHTREKPYEICSMTFSEHWQLRSHKAKTHLKIQPFKCEICGKGFYLKCDLNSHNVKVHTKEFTSIPFNFKCEYCKKPYKVLGALKIHTIFCPARPDLIVNDGRDEEAVLFVEPPLNDFPDDGEDEVGFINAEKDPLEL